MSATDKLARLVSLAKCSVTVAANPHRDVYESAEEWLARRDTWAPAAMDDVPADARATMIATDTVIEVQVYPDTPNGSFVIVHHDLGAALDIAIEAIESKRERAS